MPSLRLAIDVSGRILRVLEGLPGGPVRCGELSVPDGAIEGGRISDPAAVGSTLRQLLARTEVMTTRALIAASDVIASFRVLKFPDGTNDDAIDAAVRSQLPAADERLAVRRVEVLSRQPGRTVYATVWDRGQVNAIADCARQAGIEPAVVELKSLSVARAVPLASCVVLDATAEPYEVLLIEDHIPRAWHSFFPKRDVVQAAALAAGIRPVLSFYRQTMGEALPAEAPIVVRADQPPPAHLAASLAELCGRPVEVLPRPGRIDPDVRLAPYLACVGLVMRRRA